MAALIEPAHPLLSPYLKAQLTGARDEALRVVLEDGLARGLSIKELELGVLSAAQREIGRLWQENQVSVAEEHLATSVTQLVMSHLYRHLPRESHNGKVALVACVEGELHDMGGRFGADFLEMAGFEVRFLGANVPTKSLLAMVERDRPDVVGLSAAMSFHLPALRAAIDGVRALRGQEYPIIVGGHVVAWSPGLARELGVQALGTCADRVVKGCREYLGC